MKIHDILKNKKDKRIAIIATITILIIICAVVYLLLSIQNTNKQSNNTSTSGIENTNVLLDNMNNNETLGGSTNNSTSNIQSANSSASNNSSNNNTSKNTEIQETQEQREARDLSSETKAAQLRDDSIDKDRAKQAGDGFAAAFLEYNKDTINSGAYKDSFMKYVNSEKIKSSKLISQHANTQWLAACGTYNETYSHVITHNVQSDPIYSATNSGYILVSVNVTMDATLGDPSEFVDWQQQNRFERTYGVYLDPNDYKVVDIKKQTSKDIEVNINNWQTQEYGAQ